MFDFKSGITFTILLVVDLHAYFKRELVYIVYIMKLFSVLHDCMKHVSKLNNFNWNLCAYLEYAKYKEIYFKLKSLRDLKYNHIFILMPLIMFSVYVRCLIVYQVVTSLYADFFTCTNSSAKSFTMCTRVSNALLSKTFLLQTVFHYKFYENYDHLEEEENHQ